MRLRLIIINLLFFYFLTNITLLPAKALNNEVLKLSFAKPVIVNMSEERLQQAYRVIEDALKNKAFPGAVCLIARYGKVVGFKAFGDMQIIPEKVIMKKNTFFDLASLTKPVVTATSIMILLESGLIRLEDKVSYFIPYFSGGAKDDVTIKHLLTHTSGLPDWQPFYKKYQGYENILNAVINTSLVSKPGEVYLYSDLGYILLGEIVNIISGKTLDVFAEQNIFIPLGMKSTFFNPGAELQSDCAATELDDERGGVVKGVVHDENAFAMGGVAGHAGLFSTAWDLAIFAQMMLNGGYYGNLRILSPATVNEMTKNQISGIGNEGFGWFTKGNGTSAGDLLSNKAYGHTGFTGASIWIDPQYQLITILLTNRVHPTRDNNKHIRVRSLFQNAVASSIIK